MRVIGTLAALLVAGLGLATPSVAQPTGRLDVEPIVAALTSGERIIRAPGAVAGFDEARVRDELGPNIPLVVLPYVDHDTYQDATGDSQYYELVLAPIQDWSQERKVPVLVADGLAVTLFNGPSTRDHRLPADLDELRATTSTGDITERLIVLARLGRGLPSNVAEDVEIAYPPPVPAAPDQLAAVITTLRDQRLYNAPGRADPIEDWVVRLARQESGIGVRVAAFPVLAPGQPVVDYATPLGAAFPDDVVLVLHGDWVDIVAGDQRKALAARAFAYGDADLALLSSGVGGNHLLRETVNRLDLLLADTSWGYPQPPPQPRARVFDVQRTVSAFAPWVLVGSAVALGGAAVLRHRRRVSTSAATEKLALRAESASAMATIGDLGARVLSEQDGGAPADPAAAERHATARLLYDQAHTSVAMIEVRRVAEEGLALLTEPKPKRRRRKAKSR